MGRKTICYVKNSNLWFEILCEAVRLTFPPQEVLRHIHENRDRIIYTTNENIRQRI